MIALDQLGQMWLPVEKSWHLNERHYGALQGLNKAEMAARFGEEQVLIWRRSYDIPPPPLKPDNARYEGSDARYAGIKVPQTECLKDTVARVVPYWEQTVAPAVRAGKRVLIAAHGNSLRALVKHLDSISDTEIVKLNIPTGIPLVYELDDSLTPQRHYYLGDPNEVARRVASVAAQGESESLTRAFLLAAALAAAPALAAAQQDNLERLRKRIDALHAELEKKEGSQREARDALRDSERAISASNRRLARLGAEAREVRTDAARIAREREAVGREVARSEAAIERMLIAQAAAGAGRAARRLIGRRSGRCRTPPVLSGSHFARGSRHPRRAARRHRRAGAPRRGSESPRRAPARHPALDPR